MALLGLGLAWYPWEVARRIGLDQESARQAIVPSTWLAASFPTNDPAHRQFAIERTVRVRDGALLSWSWQQRLLAWRATKSFAADRGASAVGRDALAALVGVNGRSNLSAPYAIQLLEQGAPQRDEDVLALYSMIATVATRTGDAALVPILAKGLEHPSEFCSNTVAICCLNLPKSLWSGMDDATLTRVARQIWQSRSFHADSQLSDRLLLALSARPAVAQSIIESMLAAPPKFKSGRPDLRTVEMLTVLRRHDGKPDPLKIVVKSPRLIWTPGTPLELEVGLENREKERPEWVNITHGGNYRSGRPERWRLSIRDADNAEISPLPQRVAVGGGISYVGPLLPEQPAMQSLPFERYVRALPPGRYTLRVQYHDRIEISSMAPAEELFIFESDPVELIVPDQ